MTEEKKGSEAGAEKAAETEVVEAAEVVEAEQEAGFAAGFAEARGDEPPAPKDQAERKAEEPAKQDEPAPAKKDEEDPWKDVPAGMRLAFEAMSAQMGKVESIAKTAVGRVGAVQAALEAQKKALAAGKEAPDQEQIASATATAESWKKLKDEYPDWAGPMEQQLAAIRAEIPKGGQHAVDVDAIRNDMVKEFAPAFAAVERRAREFAQVDVKHENWEQLVNTPDFKGWLGDQPADTRRLAASPRGRDAIKLIDTYKEHVGKRQAPPKEDPELKRQRLEAAVPATAGKSAAARQAAVQSEEQGFVEGFKSVRGPHT